MVKRKRSGAWRLVEENKVNKLWNHLCTSVCMGSTVNHETDVIHSISVLSIEWNPASFALNNGNATIAVNCNHWISLSSELLHESRNPHVGAIPFVIRV